MPFDSTLTHELQSVTLELFNEALSVKGSHETGVSAV
jgi:hypothetical protein